MVLKPEKKIRCSRLLLNGYFLSHHAFYSLIRSPDKERLSVGRVPTSLCGLRENKLWPSYSKSRKWELSKALKYPAFLSFMVSFLINHISQNLSFLRILPFFFVFVKCSLKVQIEKYFFYFMCMCAKCIREHTEVRVDEKRMSDLWNWSYRRQ